MGEGRRRRRPFQAPCGASPSAWESEGWHSVTTIEPRAISLPWSRRAAAGGGWLRFSGRENCVVRWPLQDGGPIMAAGAWVPGSRPKRRFRAEERPLLPPPPIWNRFFGAGPGEVGGDEKKARASGSALCRPKASLCSRKSGVGVLWERERALVARWLVKL